MTAARQLRIAEVTLTILNNVGSGVTVVDLQDSPLHYGFDGESCTWMTSDYHSGVPDLAKEQLRKIEQFLGAHSIRRKDSFHRRRRCGIDAGTSLQDVESYE
ncbi:MAG: hypothetical protein HN341_02505 [Verrucomicrobia bacterium]|jgi:hypothetical protein|nr:hypothetical protein [Verrucomicrobiota bacterium]